MCKKDLTWVGYQKHVLKDAQLSQGLEDGGCTKSRAGCRRKGSMIWETLS